MGKRARLRLRARARYHRSGAARPRGGRFDSTVVVISLVALDRDDLPGVNALRLVRTFRPPVVPVRARAPACLAVSVAARVSVSEPASSSRALRSLARSLALDLQQTRFPTNRTVTHSPAR